MQGCGVQYSSTPCQLKFGITTLNMKKQEETFFAAIVLLLSGAYKALLKNKNEIFNYTSRYIPMAEF